MRPRPTQIPPQVQPNGMAGPRLKARLQQRKCLARTQRRSLVLHHDMRPKSLPVLCRKIGRKRRAQRTVQARGVLRRHKKGNAAADRPNRVDAYWKRISCACDMRKRGRDLIALRQRVKQGQMRRNTIQLRRKVDLPEPLESLRRLLIDRQCQNTGHRASYCLGAGEVAGADAGAGLRDGGAGVVAGLPLPPGSVLSAGFLVAFSWSW